MASSQGYFQFSRKDGFLKNNNITAFCLGFIAIWVLMYILGLYNRPDLDIIQTFGASFIATVVVLALLAVVSAIVFVPVYFLWSGLTMLKCFRAYKIKQWEQSTLR